MLKPRLRLLWAFLPFALAAVVSLGSVPGAVAVPGVSAEPPEAPGFVMYVVSTPGGLPDGGTIAFTSPALGIPEPAPRSPALLDGLSASTGQCSGTSPLGSSCSAAFTNEPGTVRRFNVVSTGFAGRITATIIEPEPDPDVPPPRHVCEGPAISLAPAGLSCSGDKIFTSKFTSLVLQVKVSGTGFFWVEVE